ncbi:MAG: thiamine pyrophosphate-binding protein [Elusimicrobia bacterium]|nr:thiamine pyrophosphate-binding protein [Elusimicrobiota bacterium]
MNGAQIVVKALEDEGVRFTFGIPGTHNIELYDALDRSQKITPILVTDEQSASFMADAVSRTSDQVGVVNVVLGPGLTHCLSGVAEAFMDNVPMVVLTAGVRNDTGKSFQLHQIEQMAVVRPVVKAVLKLDDPWEIYPLMRQAFALARSGAPGPVAVAIPANYFVFSQGKGSGLDFDTPGVSKSRPDPFPVPADLDQAAAMLNRAGCPALYIGNGAKACQEALVRLAEKLQAPVATTIQGKGVFPESHPLWLWNGFGNSAPAFVKKIMDRADCLLAVGCRFGEVATASYGLKTPENLIHVDIDQGVLNKNYPAKLAMAAEAGLFLDGLLERLKPRQTNDDLKAAIEHGHRQVWAEWLNRPPGSLVSPPCFFRALQTALGKDAIYVTDSGNGMFLAMEMLRLDSPGRFLGPVDFSCMGYSIPAAIGAKLANPDRTVAALAGDGALLMTGLEMMTAAHYGAAPLVFVLRDGELGQIAQFQRTVLNRDTCSVLHPYDLKSLADSCRAAYLEMPDDHSIEKTISEALSMVKDKKPVVVSVAIDYSQRTFFSKGAVKTNLWRLPWTDKIRMLGRAARRHLIGP